MQGDGISRLLGPTNDGSFAVGRGGVIDRVSRCDIINVPAFAQDQNEEAMLW
jgi:hypothetical protein